MNNNHPFHLRFLLLSLIIGINALFMSCGRGWAETSLNATLCDNIDLIRGTCGKTDNLPTGADEFTIALTDGRHEKLLVRAAWEALETEYYLSEQSIAEKTILLKKKETGFITFQAPASGLLPGKYRIRFMPEGQSESSLEFHVLETEDAAGQDTPPDSHQGSKTDGKVESVTDALDKVFTTTEGPDTAAAGIDVVTQFFDTSLDSSSSAENTKSALDPEPVLPAAAAAGAPADRKTKKSSDLPALPALPASPAADTHPQNGYANTTATDPGVSSDKVGPLELAVAQQIDSFKTPLETPEEFTDTDERIYLAVRSNDPDIKDLVKVRFVAGEVEGMAPGKIVAETDVVLKVNDWNAAQFLPPYGGFWPGTYRAVVEQSGRQLAEVSFRITSPVTPALLLSEIPAVDGINLAQSGLGGKVVSATSEANHSSWAKEGAADGYGYGGEDCKPACGWASSDRKFPQELVFSFFNGSKAVLKGVILDTESCAGDENCIQSMPRLVDILVSEQAEDNNFTLAATSRLRPVIGRHFIPLAGVDARFVKLVIRSNYGGIRRTQLAEFEILEDPDAPSILQDFPVDLLLPALGGNVVRFSSERYGHEARKITAPDTVGKYWRSADGALPQEHTFCFRGDQEALIDLVEIDPGKDPDASSRVAEVAVLLSSSSPIDDFREVARIEIPREAGIQKIPIGRKAKFVKLRLLANHGGSYTSLGKVRITEGREPGYVKVLQRPSSSPPEQSFSRLNDLQSVAVDADMQPGLSREEAPELNLGERIRSHFTEGEQRHYYRLTLTGSSPGMLDLELMGQPFLRTRLTLKNAAGDVVAEFLPKRNNSLQTTVSWYLEPGRYILETQSIPANLVLAWDVSGSMAENTDLLQQAVTGFLEKVRPSEKLNLIAFNNEVKILLDEFTSDREKLLAAVSGKFKAEMATRLYDAVDKGIALLEESNTTGAMVIMTDGVDMGSVLSTPDFWSRLDNNPVRLFTIGLGGEVKVRDPEGGLSGEHLLRHIAEATGGSYIHASGLEQLVDIYKQIADDFMAGTTYYILPSWNTGTGMLMVEPQGEYTAGMTSPPRIELILDGSGSMKEKLDGATRMETAKQVLADLIRQLPDEIEVALRVYGHRIREGAPGDCRDTELVYPFARLDRELLLLAINKVKPLGTTPIAYALEQVAQDFGSTAGEKTVILVTDGKEECKGDLTGTVQELRTQGLNVRLHIVGFTIQDSEIQSQMQQAAAAGNGEYFPAADKEGLQQAMAATLALPFTVHDSLDNEIARGRAGQELSLAAGRYILKFDSPQGHLGEQRIEIAADRKTLVRLTKDGPELGIEVLNTEE